MLLPAPAAKRICALAWFAPFAIVLGCASAAAAQTYPSRPLRIVLGFPAGGGVDLVARILAPKVAEGLGQPVIVDNRPGASGLIGTDIAAKAAPDGHTLFLGTTGNLSINQTLFAHLKPDITRAFDPVTQMSSVPFLLYLHPALAPRTVSEFVALAKTRPGSLHYYSSGNGGLPHLAGELFNSVAGVKTVHVPYKGAAPGLTDLIAGQVQFGFGAAAVGLAHVKAGRLRVLATSGPKRLSFLPDVATMNEALPGFEVVNWYGLVVPAGTSRPVIGRLHAEFTKAMKQPDLAEKLTAQGMEPVGSSPEAFGAFIKAESTKWARVIKTANIRAD